MTSPSSSAGPVESSYAGQRLGLPAQGRGAAASWPRRIGALFVDWVASLLVAAVLTGGSSMRSHGPESWLTMLVFLIELSLLTPLVGGSFGQVLTRVMVIRLDGQAVGLPASIVRSVLICLLVPPVIYNRDRRGLHDLATGTIAVRR